MRKLFIVIAALMLFNVCVHSQEKYKKESNHKVKTSTIYVDAVCKEKQSIRFSFFNNTNWAIAVSTFSYYLTPNNIRKTTLKNGKTVYLMPNDKEISSLFYYTESEKSQEKEKSLILGGYQTDSFNTSWIGSKDSIIFSISKKELKGNTEVYILFKYEWELNDNEMFSANGVEHRVYFRFPDYNKSSQKLPSCSK